MSIDISRVARAVRDLTLESSHPIKLSHAQECVAASLGFGSLASLQADQKLQSEVEDNGRFVVLDADALSVRRGELLLAHSDDDLIKIIQVAIERIHPGETVRLSTGSPPMSVAAAIAELVGMHQFEAHDFGEARFKVVENKVGAEQGFIFDFDVPEWNDLAERIVARHGSLKVYAPASFRARVGARARPLERYYVHGDELEDRPGTYFCRACDGAFAETHFEAEHPGENGGRYFEGLKAWNRVLARYRLFEHRPSRSANAVAGDAERAREAYEASRSPFHRWIALQVKRRGALGDLASDILRDPRFPVTARSREELLEYVTRRAGWNGPGDAFKRAWREFSKQAAPTALLGQAPGSRPRSTDLDETGGFVEPSVA